MRLKELGKISNSSLNRSMREQIMNIYNSKGKDSSSVRVKGVVAKKKSIENRFQNDLPILELGRGSLPPAADSVPSSKESVLPPLRDSSRSDDCPLSRSVEPKKNYSVKNNPKKD
jgi:hypothetical protein